MANLARSSSNSSNSTIEEEGCDDFQLNNNDEVRIRIKTSIEEELGDVNSLESKCSIFRVPKRLRQLKPDAYTPQSVSIGPLHYNEEHLKPMQAQKLRYLKRFLDRYKGITLDDYVEVVSELEEEAQKCYPETTGSGFGKDEFVKIMVVDGCFILELYEIIKRGENDDLVSNSLWLWEILRDLINLENQIPFFVLERLHGLIYKQQKKQSFSFYIYVELFSDFVQEFRGPAIAELKSLPLQEGETKHFLDLIRKVLIYSSKEGNSNKKKKKESEVPLYHTSCASELKRAGVKFLKKLPSSSSSYTSLFDIDFDVNKGELTIPPLVIYDETEHILRNLIAYEQVQPDNTHYFAAYASFMDGLIDTHRDVELLEEKGIIVNHLGNPEDVVTFFNNIVKHVTMDPYLSGVIEDVENYHSKTWNKRMANLKQTYFHSPWAFISFLAAVFLLLLTVVQTICSILQVV